MKVLATVLLFLCCFAASASAQTPYNCIAGGPSPPAPAVARGYTCLTFWDATNSLSTIDTTQTPAGMSGKNWTWSPCWKYSAQRYPTFGGYNCDVGSTYYPPPAALTDVMSIATSVDNCIPGQGDTTPRTGFCLNPPDQTHTNGNPLMSAIRLDTTPTNGQPFVGFAMTRGYYVQAYTWANDAGRTSNYLAFYTQAIEGQLNPTPGTLGVPAGRGVYNDEIDMPDAEGFGSAIAWYTVGDPNTGTGPDNEVATTWPGGNQNGWQGVLVVPAEENSGTGFISHYEGSNTTPSLLGTCQFSATTLPSCTTHTGFGSFGVNGEMSELPTYHEVLIMQTAIHAPNFFGQIAVWQKPPGALVPVMVH